LLFGFSQTIKNCYLASAKRQKIVIWLKPNDKKLLFGFSQTIKNGYLASAKQ